MKKKNKQFATDENCFCLVIAILRKNAVVHTRIVNDQSKYHSNFDISDWLNMATQMNETFAVGTTTTILTISTDSGEFNCSLRAYFILHVGLFQILLLKYRLFSGLFSKFSCFFFNSNKIQNSN